MSKIKRRCRKWKQRIFTCFPIHNSSSMKSDPLDEVENISTHNYIEMDLPWYDGKYSDTSEADVQKLIPSENQTTSLATSLNEDTSQFSGLSGVKRKNGINLNQKQEKTKTKKTPKGILTLPDPNTAHHMRSGTINIIFDSLFCDVSDESNHSQRDGAVGETMDLECLENMLEDLEAGKITSSFIEENNTLAECLFTEDLSTKNAKSTESQEDMLLSFLFDDGLKSWSSVEEIKEKFETKFADAQPSTRKVTSIGDTTLIQRSKSHQLIKEPMSP